MKKRIKALFSFFILIGFFSSLVYWLFLSPFFRLTVVIIKDQNGIPHKQLEEFIEQELNKKFFNYISYRNYFLVSQTGLIQKIGNANLYPPIKDLTIIKRWHNILEVKFKKRSPKFWVATFNKKSSLQGKEDIDQFASTSPENAPHSTGEVTAFLTKGEEGRAATPGAVVEDKSPLKKKELILLKKYIIDEQGVIINDKWDGTLAKPPIIHMITNQNFIIGSQFLEEGKVGTLLQLYQSLEAYKKELGAVADYFELEPLSHEIRIRMKNKFWIYMTLEYSLQKQINYLLLVLKKIEKNKLNNVQYIDMRLEDRAYVCCNI